MPYQAGPGVVKYMPVNLDDHKPHWERCWQKTAEKRERERRRKGLRPLTPQRSLL